MKFYDVLCQVGGSPPGMDRAPMSPIIGGRGGGGNGGRKCIMLVRSGMISG